MGLYECLCGCLSGSNGDIMEYEGMNSLVGGLSYMFYFQPLTCETVKSPISDMMGISRG